MSNVKEYDNLYDFHNPYWDKHLAVDEMKGICDKVLSPRLADTAFELAQTSYGEFRSAMEALGWNGERGDDSYPSKMENAIISIRYPFLLTWLGISPDDDRDPFASTVLDDMPRGWQHSFGLDMAEDIKTVLLSAEDPTKAFGNYRVEQVKEKFGSLRWYDGGVLEEIYEDLEDLKTIYEAISARTCAVCGSTKDVYTDTGGYILPVCMECRCSAAETRGTDEALDFARRKGYGKNYLMYDLRKKVMRFLAAQRAAAFDTKIRNDCRVTTYSHGDHKEYSAYERLQENMLHLHVFTIAENMDEQELGEILSEDALIDEFRRAS